MHHLCKERYRLELHWDEIVYLNDHCALLRGARFSGPALKIALKIEAPDKIELDLTPQHLVVFDSYYIVTLSWSSVTYKEGAVFLGDATLENAHLKKLHRLENSDHVVVDTEAHEERTHAYHLVYASTVVRADEEPYKYTRG